MGYRIDECRRIYHSDFVRLQVLTVWRMDAAFQNLVQGIAADDGILVRTELLRLIIKSVTTLAESTVAAASGCLFSLQAVNISAAANPKNIFFILFIV